MTDTKKFNDASFAREVLEASKSQPVLVDVWAAWCGPCRVVGPTIDKVAETLAGRAIVGKLDADENQETVRRFEITSIPTVLVFRDGRVVDSLIGVHSHEDYVDAAEAAEHKTAA